MEVNTQTEAPKKQIKHVMNIWVHFGTPSGFVSSVGHSHGLVLYSHVLWVLIDH